MEPRNIFNAARLPSKDKMNGEASDDPTLVFGEGRIPESWPADSDTICHESADAKEKRPIIWRGKVKKAGKTKEPAQKRTRRWINPSAFGVKWMKYGCQRSKLARVGGDGKRIQRCGDSDGEGKPVLRSPPGKSHVCSFSPLRERRNLPERPTQVY